MLLFFESSWQGRFLSFSAFSIQNATLFDYYITPPPNSQAPFFKKTDEKIGDISQKSKSLEGRRKKEKNKKSKKIL
ncbi:MAG: hypothetical protein E7629_09765 [Ruminococcaceae bacterium]|nr:hypothetical protein [Oscillospiraceae bacterium]